MTDTDTEITTAETNTVTNTDTNTATHSNQLKILQYNIGKGRETTDSVLNDETVKNFTALLLQEQHWSKPQCSSLLHQSWTLLEPTITSETHPRSAIYINNAALSSAAFNQIHIPLTNVTAVAISPANTLRKPTLLINVYKPNDQRTIAPLRQYLIQHVNTNDYDNIIILGDFNLHHPLWNPQNYTMHDTEADELVEMMGDMGLRPLLPPGTITHPSKNLANPAGGTTIDLVWGNENAENILLKCQTTSTSNDHGSDHLPIEVILDFEPHAHPPEQRPYNYAKTNWTIFNTKLKEYLPNIVNPDNTTHDEVDLFATQLVEAIRKALDETTPRKKPSPHSKRWWNNDLSDLRKEANRVRNKYRRTRNKRDGNEWREKRDNFRHAVKRAKQRKWKEFVEEADERTIWIVKKYIDTAITPYYNSTIINAVSNDAKAAEFKAAFFPPPPPADLSDIGTTDYPEPVQMDNKITMQQLERAIAKTSPNKAPGPDEITNAVLKKTFPTTQHHLLALAQASINTGHFPTCFKSTITIVLRKASGTGDENGCKRSHCEPPRP